MALERTIPEDVKRVGNMALRRAFRFSSRSKSEILSKAPDLLKISEAEIQKIYKCPLEVPLCDLHGVLLLMGSRAIEEATHETLYFQQTLAAKPRQPYLYYLKLKLRDRLSHEAKKTRNDFTNAQSSFDHV
jgi:hypothetical protein